MPLECFIQCRRNGFSAQCINKVIIGKASILLRKKYMFVVFLSFPLTTAYNVPKMNKTKLHCSRQSKQISFVLLNSVTSFSSIEWTLWSYSWHEICTSPRTHNAESKPIWAYYCERIHTKESNEVLRLLQLPSFKYSLLLHVWSFHLNLSRLTTFTCSTMISVLV